jgi:hypothetical protein
VTLAIGPGQSSAVRIGRIRCSEYDGCRLGRFTLMTTQPINGAGQGELSRTQALDEIPPATLARLLE